MSMCPFLIEYDQRPLPRRLMDQHFDFGLTPQDYLTILTVPQSNRHNFRSWRNFQASARNAGSTIKKEKDTFQVNLDVQHFSPEEISVKTADGFLIVEAKHEERQDEHGFISRSFTRKYPLPEGIENDMVTSRLSSDGVLSITAPLNTSPKNSDERVVPIIQTGPVKRQGEEERAY